MIFKLNIGHVSKVFLCESRLILGSSVDLKMKKKILTLLHILHVRSEVRTKIISPKIKRLEKKKDKFAYFRFSCNQGDLAVVPEDVGGSGEVQHPIDDQLTIAS